MTKIFPALAKLVGQVPKWSWAGKQEWREGGRQADHDQFELCLAHLQPSHFGDPADEAAGCRHNSYGMQECLDNGNFL